MKITEQKLRQIIRETIMSESGIWGYQDNMLRKRGNDEEETYVDEWLYLQKLKKLKTNYLKERDPELKQKYLKLYNKLKKGGFTKKEREEIAKSTPRHPGLNNSSLDDEFLGDDGLIHFDEMNPDPQFHPNTAFPSEYDRTVRDYNSEDWGASRDPQSPGRLADEEYRRIPKGSYKNKDYEHDFRGKIGKKLSR